MATYLKITLLLIVALAGGFSSEGQDIKLGDQVKSDLQRHIRYLASYELQGRLTGSDGERKATRYIKTEFQKLGLQPGLSGSYLHPFTFYTPLRYADNNRFVAKGVNLKLEESWYPVPVSSNGEIKARVVDVSYGIKAPDLDHNDFEKVNLKGKIALVNLESPDGHHPHSKYREYNGWRKRVSMAIEEGAAAVVIHSAEESLTIGDLRAFNNLQREKVPVVYAENDLAAMLKGLKEEVEIAVELMQDKKTGRNVLAYLDNEAEKTVVIGAHYDHLGLGEFGNSRYVGPPDIHNGADDNASGVAAMLEAARWIRRKGELNGYNYLFLAFSGEELGLLGSKAFVKEEVFEKYNCAYMLNFDMVGRMNDSLSLGLNGTGTSPVWDSLITLFNSHELFIEKSESGMGASDHTSFYLQDIPSLHFFTGTHEDYHKPSDDEDKINYDGLISVLEYAIDVLVALDDDPAPAFTKTKSNARSGAPRFKVTLGIVPDYYGKANGLRIDGVSADKPADKAGLKAGDVIVRLGKLEIKDMMTYMEALSVFDKGDETEVEVMRDGKKKVVKIQF